MAQIVRYQCPISGELHFYSRCICNLEDHKSCINALYRASFISTPPPGRASVYAGFRAWFCTYFSEYSDILAKTGAKVGRRQIVFLEIQSLERSIYLIISFTDKESTHKKSCKRKLKSKIKVRRFCFQACVSRLVFPLLFPGMFSLGKSRDIFIMASYGEMIVYLPNPKLVFLPMWINSPARSSVRAVSSIPLMSHHPFIPVNVTFDLWVPENRLTFTVYAF